MARAKQDIVRQSLTAILKEENYIPPVCKAYSSMSCIHLRYLPTCEGCKIKKWKEEIREERQGKKVLK